DDGTTRLHYTTVAPSLASPDWRADLDRDDPDADWFYDWATNDPEFLTVEFVEVDGEAETPLARYVYVPGALAHGTATGFHRPTAGGAAPPPPAGVHFEVAVEAPGPSAVARVRAR